MTTQSVIEPGRLMRAAQLGIRHVGARRYVVAGSDAPWMVDLDVDPPCYCPDAEYRPQYQGKCKHTLAALLQEHDPPTLWAYATILESRARYAGEVAA